MYSHSLGIRAEWLVFSNLAVWTSIPCQWVRGRLPAIFPGSLEVPRGCTRLLLQIQILRPIQSHSNFLGQFSAKSRCLISIILSYYSPELPLSCGVGHWEQSDRHLSFFATFYIRGTLREPDLCPGATGKCNGTFVNDKVHASKKPIITTIIKGSLSIFVKNRCWQAWGAAKWRSPSIFD